MRTPSTDRSHGLARAAAIAVLAGLALITTACAPSEPDPAAQDEPAAHEATVAVGEGPGAEEVAEAQPAGLDPELTARADDGRQTTEPVESGDPTGVSIPAIGVDSEMVRLGLTAERSMEVPADYSLAGWYVHGPQPGEVGPAVIAGHVSSEDGPGVFYELHELEPGDEIVVDRDGAERVTFEVDRVEQHRKDEFPTDDVYGDTDDSQLRLITCGGEFDRQERSHRDNIIVFASQR